MKKETLDALQKKLAALEKAQKDIEVIKGEIGGKYVYLDSIDQKVFNVFVLLEKAGYATDDAIEIAQRLIKEEEKGNEDRRGYL